MRTELNTFYPSSRKQIMENAIKFKETLDIQWATVDTAENYKKHLNDCIKFPTTGRLARAKFVDKARYNYPDNVIWRNEQIAINQDKEVQNLKKILKELQKKSYSTTQKAREYIIKDGRIDLFSIKKSKGYNWFDKLCIMLTRVK